jgi:hypothetical protein
VVVVVVEKLVQDLWQRLSDVYICTVELRRQGGMMYFCEKGRMLLKVPGTIL